MPSSPPRSYIMEDGIVYLVLAEKTYPKKLAFSYLADVHSHFVEELRKEAGEACVARGLPKEARCHRWHPCPP
jgi:hypothetical protein